MTNTVLEKKLAEFITLGNELDAEAKRRYGSGAFLFHEAEGGVHLMAGDDNGSPSSRQQFIRMSMNGTAKWGCGAW